MIRNTLYLIAAILLMTISCQASGLLSQPNALSRAAVRDSGGMGFRPGPVSNFLVEIIWPRERQEAVYAHRPYEVRIIPRDRFMNPTDTTLRIRLAARFSGEFDAVTQGFFEFDMDIDGPTSFIMMSNTERSVRDQGQWILVYCVDSLQVSGQSSNFSVLSHAPMPVELRSPSEARSLVMYAPLKETNTDTFSWDVPVPADPYSEMRAPWNDSILISDQPRYTFVLTNERGLWPVRVPSDGEGLMPTKTFTQPELHQILKRIDPPYGAVPIVRWHVESSDGQYSGGSIPDSRTLQIQWSTATSVEGNGIITEPSLSQNYPNPFNPATAITFSIPDRMRAKLTVHDNLGREVAVLIDEELEPGRHTATFDGSAVPSGTYIYRLESRGIVLSRQMTLVK